MYLVCSPVGTAQSYRRSSVVCVSVCLLVTLMSPAVMSKNNQDVNLRVDLGGSKEPCMMGVKEEAMLLVVWSIEKHWESAAVYAAEGTVQCSITTV